MPLLISCVSHSYSSSDSNFANSSSHFSQHFKPGDRRTDPSEETDSIASELNLTNEEADNGGKKKLSRALKSSLGQSMASSTASRWLRPEVYPLFAAVGVAVGICGLQLVRNICINPEVRVNKENRAAGVLENFAEGEKYAEHSLRKFVRNKSPEIMPSINRFFTDPNQA